MSIITKPRPAQGNATFQVEQSPSRVRLQSSDAWERLRLMDTSGTTHRESSGVYMEQWELQGLQPGVYWIVAEWTGARSSRALVIG